MEQLYVTIAEARRVTSLSRTTIYKLISLGRLETTKVGSRRLITTNSLRGLNAAEEPSNDV